MTEESDISLPSQEPRHCPVCGIRVAAKASECLMCGAPLGEEEETEQEEEKQRKVPSWVGSVVVAVLALIILGAGGFGLYEMLAVEPESEPTTAPAPSPTPTPMATPTTTDTPLPTHTPTPVPPRAHHVQQGETLSDVAQIYSVAIDEILDLNPEVDPELIRPGQVLLVPASAAGVEAPGANETDSLESTPGEFLIHVVSSGETLSSIAAAYDVSVSVIRAANDLSPDDETIRAEQSLMIPLNTPTPTSTPTANPNATATPIPLYTSPPLLNPPDGAVLKPGSPVLLQWASVSVLKNDEWYELHLWQPAGGVISSTVRTRATAWRVPSDLLQTAEGNAPQFLWRVQVVREITGQAYEEAGKPSAPRSFVWQGPAPSPVPQTTPTP